MDLRKRILIGIAIILCAILLVLIFFFYFKGRPKQEIPQQTGGEEQAQTTETQGQTQTITPVSTVQPPPEVDAEENYVKQLATIFVERFGSYSNQNGNRHITDVLPLVTDTMATWLENQAIEQSGDYEGVTTNVVVSTIESISDTQATVHVEVQEFLESRAVRETNYRTGTVRLQKVGGEWKVSGLFWNE